MWETRKKEKKDANHEKRGEMQKGLEARTYARNILFSTLKAICAKRGGGRRKFLAFLLREISPADFFSFFPKRRINSTAPYFTLGGAWFIGATKHDTPKIL